MSKTRAPSAATLDVHAAPRAVAAAVLGLSVRRFHELVAADVLPGPAPGCRGRYDLRAVTDAFVVHRLDVRIPASAAAALAQLSRARAVVREYLRRHPEDRALFSEDEAP